MKGSIRGLFFIVAVFCLVCVVLLVAFGFHCSEAVMNKLWLYGYGAIGLSLPIGIVIGMAAKK
jgi:hypothetical protein